MFSCLRTRTTRVLIANPGVEDRGSPIIESMKPMEEMLRARPDVQAIKDLLLPHGGTDIDVPDEWLDHAPSWAAWMTQLLQRGRLMDETHVQRQPLERNECHKNTATLFLNEQVPSFATGFALHRDTVWYFHSWGIRNEDGEVIVETHQDEFQKYFGAEYSGEARELSADGLPKMVISKSRVIPVRSSIATRILKSSACRRRPKSWRYRSRISGVKVGLE